MDRRCRCSRRRHLVLCRRLGGAAALLVALWLVSDPSFNAAAALQQHEPSARIVRSLLQVNLGLWCAAASVAVFRRLVAAAVLEDLLFRPPHYPDGERDDDDDDDAAPEGADQADGERPSSTAGWGRLASWIRQPHRRRNRYRGVETVRRDGVAPGHLEDLVLQEEEVVVPAAATMLAHEEDEDEHDTATDDVVPKGPRSVFRDDQEVTRHGGGSDEPDGLRRDHDEDRRPQDSIPTAQSICHAALDNLLVILVGLFLFTVTATGYMRRQDEAGAEVVDDDVGATEPPAADTGTAATSLSAWTLVSRIAAPTFPLLLYVYACVAAVVPWRRRRRAFWATVSRTPWAPWVSPVTFRDGFIGDVLTSSVRPLQDLAFTMCYILFGLKGWWSSAYYHHVEHHHAHRYGAGGNGTDAADESWSFIHQADASVPEMEKSWLVHTVVLPTCMVSPLFWRFLQNLRQCFDAKTRWPYLGNAFKYFLAAQVAMFGIYHPDQRNSVLWILSFVVATLYQVWWDIFMDWSLFQRDSRSGRWGLRSQRLYARPAVYWVVCTINVSLRFCWILTFLPPRYLDAAGRLTESFGDGLGAVFGPSLASAEIVRRSLWGLLRFEWEAIKEAPSKSEIYATASLEDDEGQGREEDGLEMTTTTTASTVKMAPMDMKRDAGANSDLHQAMSSLRTPWWRSDMSNMDDIQIVGELSLYTTAFLLVGLLAAAHRETL